MSSDNFWYVKGGNVYMGFASEHETWMAKAEKRFKAYLGKSRPMFTGTHEEAVQFAYDEYAEYGCSWIDEE